MPIKIPRALPAYDILKQEGVMVMDDMRATRQDIRPLHIALLNLMPQKIQTETQFARLIGATPLQIELTLVYMSSHRTKTTPQEHMQAFYQPFNTVRDRCFDGLIITGAPIEHLAFQEITYWHELQDVFQWLTTHVYSTLGICWAAMAMLYHFHGIDKRNLPNKAFGCFEHRVLHKESPYVQGFSDSVIVPVSRWTEINSQEVKANTELTILLHSDETGPCLIHEANKRMLYLFNHFEYDSHTLHQEYMRDKQAGVAITAPHGYYRHGDLQQPTLNTWRAHAHLFYGNWINTIYQTTPFDLMAIHSN